jgi:hypothetical protein
MRVAVRRQPCRQLAESGRILRPASIGVGHDERNIQSLRDVRGIETERWAAAWPQ